MNTWGATAHSVSVRGTACLSHTLAHTLAHTLCKLIVAAALVVPCGCMSGRAVYASGTPPGKTPGPTSTQPPDGPSKPDAGPVPGAEPCLCPACPTQPPQVMCPPPPAGGGEGFLSRYGKDTFFSLLGVVLGMLVSFYATMLFERYKRFRETLLDIARKRQLDSEAYPTSTKNLLPVYDKALEYWRFLEGKQWTLNADGHVDAAAQVGRLASFAYRSAACIEHLMQQDSKGLSGDHYLQAFQIEYRRIYDANFVAFENRLKPNIKALLQPYPHAYAPTRATVVLVDFFDKLP